MLRTRGDNKRQRGEMKKKDMGKRGKRWRGRSALRQREIRRERKFIAAALVRAGLIPGCGRRCLLNAIDRGSTFRVKYLTSGIKEFGRVKDV